MRPFRYRDRLFWDGAIAGNIKLKSWARDTKYEIDYYQTTKGYDKGLSCAEQNFSKIESKGHFDESLIYEHSKQYLDSIVDLCQKRNIPLFLVSSPISTMQQMNIGNYQGAIDYYKKYAREKGVHYFDMNMIKQRDEIFNDKVMSDPGHLCEAGAKIASRICAELIRDELNEIDTNDLFYESMDDLSSDIKRVVAVGAEIEKTEGTVQINNIRSTAGKDMHILLDVEVSEDGTTFISKFKTQNNGDSFEIPLNDFRSETIFIRITGTDALSGSEAMAVYTVDIV